MADPSSSLGYDWFYGTYQYVDADGVTQTTHDMAPDGRSASGADLVSSAIVHRLTTDLLPLIDSEEDNIEYGEDVRRWVGAGLTADALAARAAALGPVIERDPRVLSSEVTSEISTAAGALFIFKLFISAQLRTGETIDRVIGVSDVTVQLLAEGR